MQRKHILMVLILSVMLMASVVPSRTALRWNDNVVPAPTSGQGHRSGTEHSTSEIYTAYKRYADGKVEEVGTAEVNDAVKQTTLANDSDWQPLSSDVCEIGSNSQVYLLAPSSTKTHRIFGMTYDSNSSGEFTQLYRWKDSDEYEEGVENHPASTGGDFDGDGCDELVTLTNFLAEQKCHVEVYDDLFHNFTWMKKFTPQEDGEWFIGAATGDLDGDRTDELVIVATDELSHNAYFYIYSYNATDDTWSLLKKVTDPTLDADQNSYQSYEYFNVGCGDVDNDSLDELVAVTSWDLTFLNIWVFDHAEANFSLLDLKESTIGGDDMSLADYDGDDVPEIMVYTGTSVHCYTVEDGSIEYEASWGLPSDVWGIRSSGRMAGYDCRIDDHQQVAFAFTDNSKAIVAIYQLNISTGTANELWKHTFSTSIYYRAATVCTGNFDLDPFQETVVAYCYPQYEGSPVVMYVIDDYNTSYNIMYSYERTCEVSYANPSLCAIDSDGSILLRYLHEHNRTYSRPYVMAVMAAPPTVSGISQNYLSTSTKFGTAVEQSSSVGNGYSVTTGITLSYEAGDPFGLFKAEASLTFSTEFERTNTVTETFTECREFTGSYEHDYVIFETVLYDNYYYEICAHPNRTQVGSLIAISVPGTPQVYKWTTDYFNDAFADFMTIGPETFNHTIGNPGSYPTWDKMRDIEEKYDGIGFWRCSKTMAVGQGTGSNAVEIDLSTEQTSETSLTLTVEFEAGFSVGGVGLSVSCGYGHSWAYSITVGQSTAYRGDVGDITASDEYEAYRYSYGIFVYNFKRPDSPVRYQVLNYWVEDYNPPQTTTGASTTGSNTTTAATGFTLPTWLNLPSDWRLLGGAGVAVIVLGAIVVRRLRHGASAAAASKAARRAARKKSKR